jgi:cell division septum initiation protein DivIVA
LYCIAARATLNDSVFGRSNPKLGKTPVSEDIIKLMPRTPKQDTELLEAALIGFQHKRDQVEQKIAELRSQIGGAPASGPASAASAAASAPKKRTMSASARRRIALAQKKRWAAYKAGQGTKAPATKAAAPKPKKRVISAAGRARIVAATKKRWAAYRKAQEAKKAG